MLDKIISKYYKYKKEYIFMKTVLIIFFIMPILLTNCAHFNDTRSDIQAVESDVRIKITIGDKEYIAVIYDNETAMNFISNKAKIKG